MEQFRNLFGPLKPVGSGANLPSQGQEVVSGKKGTGRSAERSSVFTPSRDRVDVGRYPYLIEINQKIAERFHSLSVIFGLAGRKEKSTPAETGSPAAKKEAPAPGRASAESLPSTRPGIMMSRAPAPAETPPAAKKNAPAPDRLPTRLQEAGPARIEASSEDKKAPVSGVVSSYMADSSTRKTDSAPVLNRGTGLKAAPEKPSQAAPKPGADAASGVKISQSSGTAASTPAVPGLTAGFQSGIPPVLLSSLNQLRVGQASSPDAVSGETPAQPGRDSRQSAVQPSTVNSARQGPSSSASTMRQAVSRRIEMPSLRPSGTTAIPAASRLEEKARKMEKEETPPPLQQARAPVQEPPRQIREEAPRPQETAKQEPQNQPPREELEARLLLPPRADTLRGRAGMTAPASTGSGIDETPRKETPERAVDSGSSPGILTRRDIHRLFYSVAGNEIQPAQENKASGRPPVKDELRRTEQQAFVSSAIQHHEEARTKPDLHLPMLSQAAAEFVPRDVRKKEEKGSEPPVAEAAGEDSGDASAAKIDSSGPFSDITSSRKSTARETQDAVQVSFQAGKEPVTEAGKTGSVHLAAHEEESPRPSLSISSGDNPPPPIVQASFVRKSRVSPEPPADESRIGGEAARAHVLQAGQKEPVRTGSRDFRYVSFSVGEMDTLSEKIASRSSARTIDFSQSRSLIVEVSRTSETPADEKGGQGGFGQGSGRERPYDFKSEYILNQLRKQQVGDNRGRNILETAKEATIQKCMEDALQIEYFSRMAPLKHSQQASRMATTCIEVIIRKSYRDDVTGERSAAKMLALLLKSNSDYTFEHSARVMDLSVSLAAEMGIRDENELKAIEEGALLHDIGETQVAVSRSSPEEQDRLALFLEDVDLARCSEFHDIGKVKIPAEILNKTGPLTREEQIILKQHPVIGEEMLRPIPSMRPILSTVRGHHERWDGDGYPDGLKGEDIPLAARIISITDTWDAMISDRPYHKAVPLNLAARELRKGAGSQFDPELVDRFLALVEKRVSS